MYQMIRSKHGAGENMGKFKALKNRSRFILANVIMKYKFRKM